MLGRVMADPDDSRDPGPRAGRVDRPGRWGDRCEVWRTRLFVVVLFTSIVVAAIETVEVGGLAWLLAPAALVAGAAAGVAAGRSRGDWPALSRTLVLRLAAVGVAVFVLYVALSLLQARLAAVWVHAPVVAPVLLAAVAGVCVGVVLAVPKGMIRLAESLVGGPPRPGPPR